jgi:hypothetical protein
MNKIEQKQFIHIMMDNLKAQILSKADKFPEDWGGWELRQYVADKSSEVVWSSMKNPTKKRKYNNDCLIKGL